MTVEQVMKAMRDHEYVFIPLYTTNNLISRDIPTGIKKSWGGDFSVTFTQTNEAYIDRVFESQESAEKHLVQKKIEDLREFCDKLKIPVKIILGGTKETIYENKCL